MMRILFVTSGQIGDAVLTTGLLGHLIETHPGASVTIVVAPRAAPLFRAVPGLERLIALEKRSYARHWLELYRLVAPRRWDIAVDLRNSAILWLVLARERHVMGKGDPREHRVVQLARLFDLSPPPSPRLWLGEREREQAARLLGDGPVLALAPGANFAGKQWPAERFVELARRLTAPGAVLAGARIAVFGIAAERAQTAPVLEAVPREHRIDATDGLDLGLVAACLARSRLFVGNDSGLMHIAAAVGVSTLGLFGPSPDRLYAPWGEFTAVARTDRAYLELWEGFRRGEPIEGMMETLPVERAEQAAIELWRRGESR
jgi:heptosyltransferase III